MKRKGEGRKRIGTRRMKATSDVLKESFLELCNPGGVKFVKESTDSAVDNGNLTIIILITIILIL